MKGFTRLKNHFLPSIKVSIAVGVPPFRLKDDSQEAYDEAFNNTKERFLKIIDNQIVDPFIKELIKDYNKNPHMCLSEILLILNSEIKHAEPCYASYD